MPHFDEQHLPPRGHPLSGLADALDANTLDNGDFAQLWRWKPTTTGRACLTFKEFPVTASGIGTTTELVRIDVGDANTTPVVHPFSVYRFDTLTFRIARGTGTSGTVLALEATTSAPTYAFTGSTGSGMTFASSQLQFSNGGTAVLALDTNANLKVAVGNVGASMTNGISLANGTAMSADSITSGNLQHNSTTAFTYRSSVASEGSGQNNYLHNRTANQSGVGTNYTLTTSSAKITFGTTSNSITLPSAGTFLLIAQVSYTGDAVGAADIASFKLFNTTDSTTVGVERNCTAGLASGQVFVNLCETVVTTAASKVIDIYGRNQTSARGIITSTTTSLHYVRLS